MWTEWGLSERMTTRGLRDSMVESGEVPEMQREKMERDRWEGWFYFNFLGLCFVFVFMFNSLFSFNLMFLFIGFVIFGF